MGTKTSTAVSLLEQGLMASGSTEMGSWTMGRVGRDPRLSGQGYEGPQYP